MIKSVATFFATDFILWYDIKDYNYYPVFDTKNDIEASQLQCLWELRGFLKFSLYTLRIRFFCLCTNIFHFFDRNNFFRSVKTKRIM